MKTIKQFTISALVAALLLGVAGCTGMSQRDKNTAIGAGVGAVGGAVITDGSTAGTIGGAAVGGIIGNQIDKDDN
ncbi:MAG: glycine zipper 2TM domain-containing protein [Thiohalobacteraceae bacterium]